MSTPTHSALHFEVANAHGVTDFLAVGGDLPWDIETAEAHSVDIVDAGITHVLDVRYEADDAEFWSDVPEITYSWNGIDDAGQQVPAAWFDEITGWAVEAINAGGAVLTHCHMGINRGPSAGFAVLLALGWDAVDALTAIRSARPIAHIWYAEDALAWHFERTGATSRDRRTTLARVHQWRRDNPLDVVRVIADARRAERQGLGA